MAKQPQEIVNETNYIHPFPAGICNRNSPGHPIDELLSPTLHLDEISGRVMGGEWKY